MFKRFVIHLGNGLFLSKLCAAVETVAVDAEKIASAVVPVVLEVGKLENAVVADNPQDLIEHVTQLGVLIPNLFAEVHEVVTTPVWSTPVRSNLNTASAPSAS